MEMISNALPRYIKGEKYHIGVDVGLNARAKYNQASIFWSSLCFLQLEENPSIRCAVWENCLSQGDVKLIAQDLITIFSRRSDYRRALITFIACPLCQCESAEDSRNHNKSSDNKGSRK